MIPIEKESEDMIRHTRVYEHCIFCDRQTDMWHNETNRPVCDGCAIDYEVEDIKTAPYGY